MLLNLAMVLLRQGRGELAAQCLDEARVAVEASGNRVLGGWPRKYQGYAHLLRQDYVPAAEEFREASRAFEQAGNETEARRCHELAEFADAPLRCDSMRERLLTWRRQIEEWGRIGWRSRRLQELAREAMDALAAFESAWRAATATRIPDEVAPGRVAAALRQLLESVSALSDPELMARSMEIGSRVIELSKGREALRECLKRLRRLLDQYPEEVHGLQGLDELRRDLEQLLRDIANIQAKVNE